MPYGGNKTMEMEIRQKHHVLSVLKLMKPDFHKALTAKSDSWLEQKPFVGLAAHKNMSPSRNKMEVLLFTIFKAFKYGEIKICSHLVG